MLQNIDFNALVDELAVAIAKRLVAKLKDEVNTELKNLVVALNASEETKEVSATLVRKDTAPIPEEVPPTEVTSPEDTTPVPTSFSVTENKPVFSNDDEDLPPYVAMTSENMSPDAFMQGLQIIAESAMVSLPEQYQEAVFSLSKKDQKTARIFLRAMNPTYWMDMIEGSYVFDVEDMMDMPIPDSGYRRYLNDYVRGVFEKIHKHGLKIQRSKDISAANLKRMAEAREKRRLLAERQLAKKNEAEAKRKAACADLPQKVELYIPKIEKKLRKKIIIVGLLQAQQGLIQTEFGNTFIMDMIESSGGVAKLKQVNDDSGKMVFVMADFISHSHTDNIAKEVLTIVKGGMTSIREALSDYAKESYPA